MVESVLDAAKYVLPIAVSLLGTAWCVVYARRRDEADYRVLDFIRYGCIVCSACTLCLYVWETYAERSMEDVMLSLAWLVTLTLWIVLDNHKKDRAQKPTYAGEDELHKP